MRTFVAIVLAVALFGGTAWQIVGLWNPPAVVISAGRDSGTTAKRLPDPSNAAFAGEIITPRNDNVAQLPPAASPPPPPPAPSSPAAPAQPPAEQPAATQPSGGSQAGAQPAKQVVDETALRYFARQGDTRRLNTEIARLRSLYPDWVPPDDPLKGPTITDPQLDSLWQLYSQSQFAAARAAIAARQIKEPGWQPPKDLLDRLAVAETRERMVNASNAKQYMTVIELSTTTPSLLTCGDIDVMWRLAEAFAQTDRAGRAEDVYRYILSTCTDPHDRISTMQKAMVLLPRADLEPLFALGHNGSDGDEFRGIREGVARNSIAAGGADAKVNAEASDLKLLADSASTNNSASDALLLGNYYRLHNDLAQAERWYRLSYERQNAAASAEGLALTLITLKRSAEAEAILAPWHETSDGTRRSYTGAIANLLAQQPPPQLPPDVLSRVVTAIASQRDAAAAQQLGWYSRFYGQNDTAARWFAAALTWKPDDEPSAFGLALANQSLNRRDVVKAIANVWGARSLRIRAIVDPVAAKTLALRGNVETPATQLTEVPAPLPTSGLPALVPASPAATLPPAQGAIAPIPAGVAPTPLPATPAPAPLPAPQAVAQPAPPNMAQPPGADLSYLQPQPADATPEPAAPAPRQRGRRQGAAGPSGGASSGRGTGGTGGAAAGWNLMKLDRAAEAATAFRDALSRGSAKDRQSAAYGLSLAYMRLGLLDQAAAASTQAPLPGGQARQLNTAISTQRIIADYQAGRYSEALIGLDARSGVAPEQTDLLMVRGWSYYHLLRYREARQVFEAVAATGNAEARSAIEAVKEATHSRY